MLAIATAYVFVEGLISGSLIEEGDPEANYAYYCLHKLHILPSQYLEMDEQDKAFVIAAIRIKLEKEKKEAKNAERNAKPKGGKGGRKRRR